MQDESQKTDSFSTLLTVIFAGLMMGQLAFGAVAFFVLKPPVVPSEDPMFLYLLIGLTAVGILAGFVFHSKMKSQIRNMENLDEKLAKYRSSAIIRMALLEGSNLFGIVAYLQTGNPIIMGITAGGMVIFATYIPLKTIVKKDLGYSNSI
ncbi:MAG TPA: hypothetical protein VK151_01795 [Fluviicola sp.]|nr:hypothetical protein [Fluviicola sp.]